MSLALKEAVEIAKTQLENARVTDAKHDAKELYKFMAGLDEAGYIMGWQKILSDEEVEKYFDLVSIRASRIPLQYIVGNTSFMGFNFKVNENVLIPRFDTEPVLEEAIKHAKGDVLDLCTGSGAIAISIAKLAKGVNVTATDISEEALKIAEENAKDNSAKVKFLKSDMFESLKGALGKKKFNLIVSNPPYIETVAIDTLEPEVANHEPRLALDGGKDGLDFYRIIASHAYNHLKKKGVLVLEIGDTQGKAVSELLLGTNEYIDVEVKKDLAGNDRMVICKVK